ncbi:hypothetical protein BGAL_0239g00020 [Botrytis galanthina]|uniref:Uncharacterized protein n=1 Tax=Botrytis galanthina TaxID=278940 RepID=A0A4S8QUK6_9HELO|nr:hypothetical protein BGAL_0239g00020 [Botrytis galanthina]
MSHISTSGSLIQEKIQLASSPFNASRTSEPLISSGGVIPTSYTIDSRRIRFSGRRRSGTSHHQYDKLEKWITFSNNARTCEERREILEETPICCKDHITKHLGELPILAGVENFAVGWPVE